MASDAQDAARGRLTALAADPTAPWAPARRLEEDAALLGRLLTAADRHQRDDGRHPDVAADDVGAALSLFEEMRVGLDRLEAQVVMEARRRGMDWRQIARHQGLNSSQAASQRYQRLMTRLEEIRQGVR
ncbi:hypothetical protein ACWC10_34890 [Streptomyces sp. NPDC001595]|uniref:hypothetical protein n=1 Tax=Streptomyces sp. NPDC001532 TaxID=3154520 RepID=UPI00331FAD06